MKDTLSNVLAAALAVVIAVAYFFVGIPAIVHLLKVSGLLMPFAVVGGIFSVAYWVAIITRSMQGK